MNSSPARFAAPGISFSQKQPRCEGAATARGSKVLPRGCRGGGGASGRAHQPKHYQKCSGGSVELGGGDHGTLRKPRIRSQSLSLGSDSVGPVTPSAKGGGRSRGENGGVVRLHGTPRAGRVRALCSSARSKSCRWWSLRSAASGLTPSSHLPITVIDLGGGRERILGPRPDAGSLRLPPLWEFHIRFPKYHHPGEGMSPEGCSSLTLRCPEGKDQLVHCWRAYGKSGSTTFWVYWSLCSRKVHPP